MVVALRTTDRLAHPHAGQIAHAIRGIDGEILLGLGAPSSVVCSKPVVTRCDPLS